MGKLFRWQALFENSTVLRGKSTARAKKTILQPINRLIESRFSISISTTPMWYAVRCLCLDFIRGKIIITRCQCQCSHRSHRFYHCRRIFSDLIAKNRRNYTLRCRFPRDKLHLNGTRRKSNIFYNKKSASSPVLPFIVASERRGGQFFFHKFYPCGWWTSAK